MKNVAMLTEDGAFALFFHPHHQGFDSSRVPTPREFAMVGWVQVELTDVLAMAIIFVH